MKHPTGNQTSGHRSPLHRALPVLGLASGILIAVGVVTYVAQWRVDEVAPGLAKANGRIEVERVDVATKYSGRISEINVEEGDLVDRGEIVARLDMTEIQAELTAAKANVRRASEAINLALAEVALREAQHRISEIELERAAQLERRDFTPTAELDRRNAQHDVAEANLLAAQAAVADSEAAMAAAEALVLQIEAVVMEMTLRAPVAGRVEYRLVQPGTVLGAGARVVSILDLSDVYMTIFLPTSESGRVALGSDARIVLDASPTTIIPATVSFIAAEAQFTPKVVETANEREKLMYRVKLRIEPELLRQYRDYVKSGLTGDAYVQVSADAAWPDTLQVNLPNEG